MAFFTITPPIYYNIKQYGGAVDGTTDDLSVINTLISTVGTAGGGTILIPGISAVSGSIILNQPNVILASIGPGGGINPKASFSGTQIVNITANGCGIRDMTIAFANTSYASNPVANGIQITGAPNILLQNVNINYINGWAVQSTATNSVRNKWTKLDNVFSTLCAKGIHIVGNGSTNNNAAHVITNCILDQVATGSSNGDGYFIEDCYDIEMSNLECNLSAGSGSAIHIKGKCASIHIANMVEGGDGSSTTGPGVLIESGANGTPSQIEISNTIIETANDGMDVTAGTQISITDCRFLSNQYHGVYISGGDGISLHGCTFNLNNQHSGSAHYDFISQTSGNVVLTNCSFLTPTGTSGGQTAAAVSVSGGHVICTNNVFEGTTIFSGKPQVIKANNGYNPVGVLGPPAVPASTTPLTNPYSVDCTVFISGGTLTVINVGGSATGITAAAPAGAVHTVRVPALQTISITYTVAPSWTWFGD